MHIKRMEYLMNNFRLMITVKVFLCSDEFNMKKLEYKLQSIVKPVL